MKQNLVCTAYFNRDKCQVCKYKNLYKIINILCIESEVTIKLKIIRTQYTRERQNEKLELVQMKSMSASGEA